MTDKEILDRASERARKRALEIFKPAPPEVEEELKKETTLGHPQNLVAPDNKDE